MSTLTFILLHTLLTKGVICALVVVDYFATKRELTRRQAIKAQAQVTRLPVPDRPAEAPAFKEAA